MPFHVFLSHGSADKLAVEGLARCLAQVGIQARLDEWNLIVGDPWRPAIEQALTESETCAFCVGASGCGPWRNEGMRAAIDRRIRDSGRQFRLIAVLLPGAPRAVRTSLPTLLAAATWVDFRDSLDHPEAVQRLVGGIRGLPDLDSKQAPSPVVSLDEAKQRQARNVEAERRAGIDAEQRELTQKKRAEQAEEIAREQAVAVSRLRRRILLATGAAVGVSILLALAVVLWRKSELDSAKSREEARTALIQRREAEKRLQLAEEETRTAESRRFDAQTSEKRANSARDQADGLINFILYDLHNKLQEIGRLDLLEDVAKQVKEYLAQLPEEPVSRSRQEQQGTVLSNLGDVLLAQGKPQEALAAYQQDLAISQRLAGQNTSDSASQRELSVSYNKVGNALVVQGKPQEALAAYQQSVAILRRLVEQDQSNAGWRRDLSVSYDNVGDALVAQGKLTEGLDAYRQSLKIRQTLAQHDKLDPRAQRDLSISYGNVGDVLAAQGKRPDAGDAYQRSLAILKQLAEQDKSNAGLQRELSVTYNKLGDVLGAQSKFPDALDAYQQSLQIRQILSQQDKTNSSLQRDLSVSYNKLGSVLVAQGKLQEGLNAYQNSLKIRQTLVEQDVSNSGLRRDLILSLYKTGTVTGMIEGNDNVVQAQVLLRTALILADKYTGTDRQQLIDAVNQALENLVHERVGG
jgi:tetratricopeptide (TPR) repeat protein